MGLFTKHRKFETQYSLLFILNQLIVKYILGFPAKKGESFPENFAFCAQNNFLAKNVALFAFPSQLRKVQKFSFS